MSSPHSFLILGPRQAGKTLFLSTLVHSIPTLKELAPSFVLKQPKNIFPVRTRDTLQKIRTEFLEKVEDSHASSNTATWLAHHHQKVQVVELSEQEWRSRTFLLQQMLERADSFFFLLPAPLLLQKETSKTLELELEGVLNQLKQLRPQKNYTLFFLLSHADQLESNLLNSPETYWTPNSNYLIRFFKELQPIWMWFSAQEHFADSLGKYPFNSARQVFELALDRTQKQTRKKRVLSALCWLFGAALLFICGTLIQSLYWNQQFAPLFQKSKKDLFLSQVFLESTQNDYIAYRKQLRDFEYSSSFAHFSPLLALSDVRKILELYRSNLQHHLTHFGAYLEAPNQLNYPAEDYKKVLRWIEVLNENTSGDSYGTVLIQKKMEAAELKEKLPEIRAWGRLYRDGLDCLKIQPSKPLQIFLETFVISELNWAVESVWDQFYQWKPSSKLFFSRCYRFLEMNEDFIPQTLKLQFERQLEINWEQAFDELKKQTESLKAPAERFKLWESFYRATDGTVIPEADKFMPASVRLKLKQEITFLLNHWRNENAEASWDSWFGGRSERKVEQIRQLYQERHLITTKEEWDRFLSDLQTLVHKLQAEVSEQNDLKNELDSLQEWLTTLKQEWNIHITYQLHLPETYHSYFNTFVPEVTLRIQKTEEQSYRFESETQSFKWTPGEFIRIRVADVKYPYHEELQLEEPGINPFRLIGTHLYKQSEDVYISLDFRVEPTLETLEKKVAQYWSKNK